MSALSAYGFASVLLMLLAYSLEEKATVWTLIFAIGCFSSAFYGYLAGTIPFALVEGIWAIVACRKWYLKKADRNSGNRVGNHPRNGARHSSRA
jgi:hypothetical protein